MRGFISIALIFGVVAANAQVTIFNANNVAANDATRDSWLAAAGTAVPEFFEDFESYTLGASLQGAPLIGGATITDTHASPFATVQSTSGFFGGSVPFGQGLAWKENHTYEFVFASPVRYVGMYDIDQGGSNVRVHLSNSTFFDFLDLDSTAVGGSSGEFLGFVSSGAGIVKITFDADGGDGEMGIDNLQYGGEPVPEPATMAILGLGGLAVLRKRRK
ncbi:MAG: PEP-CTERM sorting domain-containing protein [Fimbriimonadaceae bacterium]|nr:PEP-CTERM sorting domain-containing protein [Fimbriimonadaceae bacterium]